MTREEKQKIVAEYINKDNAHMSIMCEMKGRDDPKIKPWVDMREALGLRGWNDTEDVIQSLRNLFAESGEN